MESIETRIVHKTALFEICLLYESLLLPCSFFTNKLPLSINFTIACWATHNDLAFNLKVVPLLDWARLICKK